MDGLARSVERSVTYQPMLCVSSLASLQLNGGPASELRSNYVHCNYVQWETVTTHIWPRAVTLYLSPFHNNVT